MTSEQIEAVKRHFLVWSGGFEPESEHQIIVYVDYARDSELDRDEVYDVLMEWIQDDDAPATLT
jgi:hypothetical protein